MSPAPVTRRVAATVVDYGLIGLWAAVLLGLAVALGLPDRLSELSPVAGQVLGLLTLTVPATVMLALSEARGASPGKRVVGLLVHRHDGQVPGLRVGAVRTIAKVALPWELAHTGLWRFMAGDQMFGLGATLLAYVALGAALAGLLRTEPWYDRVCGTRVMMAESG